MGDAAIEADVLVVGAGLAGVVTALECLRGGLRVTLVERAPAERFGGLAAEAFGGMALVGTPLQARLRIPDTPELAWQDWLRFGELADDEVWPRAWARHYVERSRADVHDWLRGFGVRFMPAVHWVERGRFGDGNSVPRYHLVWGTGRELVRRLQLALAEAVAASAGGALRVLHGVRVDALDVVGGRVCGADAVREDGGGRIALRAGAVVLACGGLNGGLEQARANWPAGEAMPRSMLCGADPASDGRLQHWAAAVLRARVTRPGAMWNYAAGIAHPRPRFANHGLSLIPCKSALWLDHRGRRIGPEPLVTGFDTRWLCERVTAQAEPWSWQLLNRRIALRELAISGAEYNVAIRDRQPLRFALELLLGNRALLRRLLDESPDVLADATLAGLAARMNARSGTADVDAGTLQAAADAFDANFARGASLHNDDQLRRVLHARQWPADRLRTCRPAPLQRRGDGPFIAIRTQLITRKSLGGLRTDLDSRVLDADEQPIDALYAVGEAAGFGGGGACGRRSLEGTFLPGCILTARAAARALGGAT
jgi:predicted oxidoreductase